MTPDSDPIDLASTISDAQNDQIIGLHLSALRQNSNPTTNCIDCGQVIPEARVEAIPGVNRCITCQAAFEEEFPQIIKTNITRFSVKEDEKEDDDAG